MTESQCSPGVSGEKFIPTETPGYRQDQSSPVKSFVFLLTSENRLISRKKHIFIPSSTGLKIDTRGKSHKE